MVSNMNNDRGLLSGSITILIGAVIAIMALVRGSWQVWLLLGVFTLWGLWVVLILLLPYMQQAKPVSYTHLIPIWYLRSTAASYKKHLNEELETAISIITTSYLRTEDLIRSVKENLPYINEPVKANFEAFVYEAELINANITSAINSLKMKIPNRVFHEWCGTLIQCQSDRSMKNTLPTRCV